MEKLTVDTILKSRARLVDLKITLLTNSAFTCWGSPPCCRGGCLGNGGCDSDAAPEGAGGGACCLPGKRLSGYSQITSK